MNKKLASALGLSALLLSTHALAQVSFYEGEGFRGRVFTTDRQVANLQRAGFNDRASSVVVERGRWEVCEDARFAGRCVILRRGSYDSLAAMGLNDRLSSVRPAAGTRYANEAPAPLAAPTYDYRRRPNERTYEARVTAVRAVLGPPEQRCWIEQQPGHARQGDVNVGGAVVGALLGGVLGHQVGSGRGNDLATAGGAIAGAAVGANVGRDGHPDQGREVRRCENVAAGKPAYWDVTYEHRGQQHRVQMASPPGETIAVNRDGEPRG